MTDDTFGLNLSPAPSSISYGAVLVYSAAGTLLADVKDAIVITVNGKEAARLDTPREHGTWVTRADLTPFIVKGGANEIEIMTNTYRLTLGGGELITDAEVRLNVGRRSLFRETFDCKAGYRRSTDLLKFADTGAPA